MITDLDFDRVRLEWKMPVELRSGVLPRDVQYTWLAWVYLIAVLAVSGVVLAMTVSAYKQYQEDRLVRSQGVPSTAMITQHWITRAKGSPEQYHVSYTYVVDGSRHFGSARVSRSTYVSAGDGVVVPIHVAAGAAAISRLDAAINESIPWFAFTPILVFFGVIGWMLFRTRRLIAFGTPAGALITKVTRGRRGGIRYQYQVGTEWLTGSGPLPHELTVREGDIMTALYDPNKPRRSIAYPSRLVHVSTDVFPGLPF